MDEKEVLVKAEGLSKKFCKDLKTSLWYGVQDLFSNLRGNSKERFLRDQEFWAVRDINFELRRGECLGLIGHNGAGKSTLLKILNGLIKPDAGKVTIKGRVGALIELGAGFNPILSGRENIYNNGAVLGFSRQEINDKLEEIIAFAELQDFIDMPVQNYSSGMKVRLGFAIAAQMKPDILIIDEVLAVGDIGFRMKCLTTIGSLLSDTAVIFVSHSMPQIARISNKILLMERGKSLTYGTSVNLGIEKYFGLFQNSDRVFGGNNKVEFLQCQISKNDKQLARTNANKISLNYHEDYIISLVLKVKEDVNNYDIHFSFIDKDSKVVATIYSYLSHDPFKKTGKVEIGTKFKNLLGQGIYSIGIAVNEVRENGANGEMYLYDSNILTIDVVGVSAGVAPVQFKGEWAEKKIIRA